MTNGWQISISNRYHHHPTQNSIIILCTMKEWMNEWMNELNDLGLEKKAYTFYFTEQPYNNDNKEMKLCLP